MKINKKIFLYLLTISIIIFSFPALSSAHAFIIKSTPADNQNLSKAPKIISIEFNEEIQPSFHLLQVFDQNGKRVDKGNEHIFQAKTIETNLKPGLPAGIYNVRWKVVSGDGHPVDGVIPFQIGKSNKQAHPRLEAKTSGYIPQLDLIILRWVQYISGSIITGMLFFYLCILPKGSLQSASMEKRYRKTFNYAYIFLLLCILLSLPQQAVIQAGRSWLNVWDLSTFNMLITGTTFGQVWVVQLLVAIILGFLSFKNFVKKNNVYFWSSFVLGIALLVLKAVTSHAFTASNKVLAITMDTLHLTAASIWIGSLVAMAVLLPLRKREEGKIFFRGILHVFFPWGVLLVLIIAITGVYSSFLYVPTIHSLFHTSYGNMLVGKIILFSLMILFAVWNSFKVRKGGEKGWHISLWGEMITGLIVLVLAVLLTNLPTAIASPGPFNETKAINKNTITLKVDPNVSGQNQFYVFVQDSNGKPRKDIQQITLTFTSKEMAMEDDTVTIQKATGGKYQTKGIYFNMAGRWNVHVHALTAAFDSIDADFSVIAGSQ